MNTTNRGFMTYKLSPPEPLATGELVDELEEQLKQHLEKLLQGPLDQELYDEIGELLNKTYELGHVEGGLKGYKAGQWKAAQEKVS